VDRPDRRSALSSSATRVGPSSIHGLGVFAERDFAAGEVVLRIDDSRIVTAADPFRPEQGESAFHCDYLARGKVVLMKAPERHINSSCDPNTYVKTVHGVRAVIALRAIPADDEITYDYLINCHGGKPWTCRCGSPACRREIPSSFFDLPAAAQALLRPLLDDWFVEEHRDRLRSGPLP
jgi:hypothetical protein